MRSKGTHGCSLRFRSRPRPNVCKVTHQLISPFWSMVVSVLKRVRDVVRAGGCVVVSVDCRPNYMYKYWNINFKTHKPDKEYLILTNASGLVNVKSDIFQVINIIIVSDGLGCSAVLWAYTAPDTSVWCAKNGFSSCYKCFREAPNTMQNNTTNTLLFS